MADQTFDVIVIGSGPGGSHAAKKLAKEGKDVAVIDYHFGGTCALRGCTPKKAIEAVTSTLSTARRLRGHGVPDIDLRADWHGLQIHRQDFNEQVVANTKIMFRKKGMTVIEGKAKFTGKKTLSVNGKTYTAPHIIVAVGAVPRPLDFPGSEYLTSSGKFLNQQNLPKRLVFAGGGYVGFELAHIAAACGSECIIVSDTYKPLQQFESDMVTQLIDSTLRRGIQVRTGYTVKKVEKSEGEYKVIVENDQGEVHHLFTDAVIHSAGRVPATADLNLEAAEAETEDGAIVTTDFLRSTTNKYVWAVGDVTGKVPLTSAASVAGNLVAENILHDREEKMDYSLFPTVLFTQPKLAGVGKTLMQLEEEGIAYQVRQRETTKNLTEKAYHSLSGGGKILLDEKGEKILGAHLIGHHAHEVINLLGMAMQFGISAKDFKNMKTAYPTSSNAVKGIL